MEIEIFRIVDKSGSSFLHEEVCRKCAKKKEKKGYQIEFDSHLYKYTYIENGISYYEDGSDDENSEINCSICGEYLVSNEKEPLKCAI